MNFVFCFFFKPSLSSFDVMNCFTELSFISRHSYQLITQKVLFLPLQIVKVKFNHITSINQSIYFQTYSIKLIVLDN